MSPAVPFPFSQNQGEFLLLLCLPIVIMTQLPTFQEDAVYVFVSVVLSLLILLPIPMTIFYVGRVMRRALSGWNVKTSDDNLGDHQAPESQNSTDGDDTSGGSVANAGNGSADFIEKSRSDQMMYDLHKSVGTETATMVIKSSVEESVEMESIVDDDGKHRTDHGMNGLLAVPKPNHTKNLTADIQMDEIEMMADMLEEGSMRSRDVSATL